MLDMKTAADPEFQLRRQCPKVPCTGRFCVKPHVWRTHALLDLTDSPSRYFRKEKTHVIYQRVLDHGGALIEQEKEKSTGTLQLTLHF